MLVDLREACATVQHEEVRAFSPCMRFGKYSEGIKCVSQKMKLRNAAERCAISMANPNKSR